MPLISDDMMQKALEYLALDPHPIAVAKGDLTRAENAKKLIPARLWKECEGTVADKKAAVESHIDFVHACQDEADAAQRLEQARTKLGWANAAIEVWRSDQANSRISGKVY